LTFVTNAKVSTNEYETGIVSLSCNHFCSGKSKSITYSERVFVELCIQHALRMHHIVIYGLPGSAIFFHIIP